ncbi:MAG: ATP-binding protein [Sphingomonas sp.]
MTVAVDMGQGPGGKPALVDLEELLATRLLVQGNSGSGKSHLLRRLLEGSAPWVQQIVIDPEGDFVTLADRFGHVAVEAANYSEAEIARVAQRIRAHRVSVVLNLEGLDIDAQMKCAATFLNALFDAPRDQWYPALVVVDEAQLFAPAVAGEVSEDARKASLSAMTNLMCRGRKRGLAGVIATQRLAKLAKNVAAEASNFLMGRTFLDIDMARAADLLGMDRRQAETIRDLERGHFLALGPALSRRPVAYRIGAVETGARSTSPKLMPMPAAAGAEAEALLFENIAAPPPAAPMETAPPPLPADELIRRINRPVFDEPSPEPVFPLIEADERESKTVAVLRDIVADADAAYRAPAVLYQDFGVRCRMRGLHEPPLDLAAFKRRLSMARAGVFEERSDDAGWAAALAMADVVPVDLLGVFLLIARAARDGAPCPSDEAVARVYGTHSTGRTRRLLGYIEARGLIVPRTDLRGRRAVGIPRLGWTTAVEEPRAPSAPETATLL